MTAPNYWFDDRCARAFWDQHQAVPYQELLQDTIAYLTVRPGDRWLDLGCGSGQLSAQLWKQSRGQIGHILAVDCAAVNAEAIDHLTRRLLPTPAPGQLVFRQGNFSEGLGWLEDSSFDGVVSGLALSYAEAQDPVTGRYHDGAFNRILAELHRVLRPGGQLVFSINVPEPGFWKIFWRSLKRGIRVAHARRVFWNALKMQFYGRWLRRQAAQGRFHFLPLPELLTRLEQVGFHQAEHRLSYAGQAYVLRVEKPQALARSA